MFTSPLKSQKFIRNPNKIVLPRQIFKRNPTSKIVVSNKIDTNTEVGFQWLFELLSKHGSDIIVPIFTGLGFKSTELKNSVIENKDKLMAEFKDVDKKNVILVVLGNLVFRVPIGIGQAIVWILKWLGNSIAVGRTVRYKESPAVTHMATVKDKIPVASETPKFIIKDTGDLESIGSYTFTYDIEFEDVTTGILIRRVVDRKDLDVDTYDFMKFAWKEIRDEGLMKVGIPIYDGLVKIGKLGKDGIAIAAGAARALGTAGIALGTAGIAMGKAGIAMGKAGIARGAAGLATAIPAIGPALAGIGTSIKSAFSCPTTAPTKCDWNTCLQQVVDDKGTGHLRKLLLLALQRLDMNTTDEYKEFKEKLIKMLESNYSLYQVFQEEVLKQLNRKYIPQVKLAEADFVEIINDDEHKKDVEEMRIVYDIYSDIPSKTME